MSREPGSKVVTRREHEVHLWCTLTRVVVFAPIAGPKAVAVDKAGQVYYSEPATIDVEAAVPTSGYYDGACLRHQRPPRCCRASGGMLFAWGSLGPLNGYPAAALWPAGKTHELLRFCHAR
jgi:hypothetical protein